jgi:hypothetical protein
MIITDGNFVKLVMTVMIYGSHYMKIVTSSCGEILRFYDVIDVIRIYNKYQEMMIAAVIDIR